MLGVFLFWLGGAVAVGMFAAIRRNRSAMGWFLLALLISPLLAGIFLAILLPREQLRFEQQEQPRYFEPQNFTGESMR
jgi:hypothetical protein